ncbi:MAG: sodium:solute symporter family transporter, partial [Planctomycetota bacterium]
TMVRLAPVGLMGVMVASFLGAFMSTVDTHLNLSAAYLVNDFYRRFRVTDASERHYVLMARLSSVAVMLLAAHIALMFDSISGLFTFLLSFTSGFGIVLILRWFWWRINAWSEISAMAASGLVSSGLYVLKSKVWPDELAWMTSQWVLLITVAVSTITWLAVTFLTAPVSAEKLASFYRRVRPYGAWGEVARRSGVDPPRGLWKLIVNWLAGTVMVLAATFAIGAFVLARPGISCLYAAAAVAGAAVIWALWDRNLGTQRSENG